MMIRRLFDQLRSSRLGRLEFLTRLYRSAIVRWHGSNEVRVGEFTLRFVSTDRYLPAKLIVDGGFEQKEIALLCSLITPGDVVLDIGANIGLYTLAMSRAVGREGKVVAFEPDPDNLMVLRHNVQANHCENVIVAPCALGDQTKEMNLFQVDEQKGYQSFADLGHTGKSVRVSMRRGDDVLRELGVDSPSVVKIDVEGAEPLVLEGLGCRPKYVQFEFVPAQIVALGLAPMPMLLRLIADGYRLATIQESTGYLDATTPNDLLELAERTGLDYNVLATLA